MLNHLQLSSRAYMYLWLSLRNYMYDCDSVFWSAFTLLYHVRFSSCQVPTYNCDTVHKPAFRLLYHAYLKRLSSHVRACISFAESWMIQFRGLYITLTNFVGVNLALIKMWLSSQSYISYAKSLMTHSQGFIFTGLNLAMSKPTCGPTFPILNHELLSSRFIMWLSSHAYF